MRYGNRMRLMAAASLAALLLVLAALVLPPINRQVKIVDALFVIDITNSMNVEDAEINGEKVDRLRWAKDMTRRTMLDMPCGSHAGLAIFNEARSLVLMSPVEVCSNYHDLIQMVDKIHPAMAWTRSSEVTKAVYTAIRQSFEIEPRPSVIFLTDGHEAPPVHESLFPRFTGTPGEVSGVIVGIGGDDLQPIPKTNAEGEIEGFWGVNEVMHVDVYASSQGSQQAERLRGPRTEHLSSQKKAHIETLASRVGFAAMSTPTSRSLLKEIRQQAELRALTIKQDISGWLAAIALGLLILIFFPYRLFIR